MVLQSFVGIWQRVFQAVCFSLFTGNGVAASGYIGGVLPEHISLGVRVDVTPNRADAERASAVWTTINGAKENGGTPPVEELTCGSVIASIERLVPGIKLDGMLSAFTSGINAAINNMTDVFGDFRFVASN